MDCNFENYILLYTALNFKYIIYDNNYIRNGQNMLLSLPTVDTIYLCPLKNEHIGLQQNYFLIIFAVHFMTE